VIIAVRMPACALMFVFVHSSLTLYYECMCVCFRMYACVQSDYDVTHRSVCRADARSRCTIASRDAASTVAAVEAWSRHVHNSVDAAPTSLDLGWLLAELQHYDTAVCALCQHCGWLPCPSCPNHPRVRARVRSRRSC
jgi:hypothetical protein